MSFNINDNMDLKNIVAKNASDLSQEEKVFLSEHKAELSADQLKAFASIFDEGAGGGEGGGDEGAGGEGGEGGGEGGAPVNASDIKLPKGMIVMSEAEAETLRNAANQGAQAFAEVEKMKLDAEVSKLVFSSTNTEGRILPKHKEALVTLMFSLNNKQRDQLRNVLSNLPKADRSIFKETGDGGAGEQTKEAIAAQVKTFAIELQKADSKLSYANAVKQVYAEKPELKTAYDAAKAAEAK